MYASSELHKGFVRKAFFNVSRHDFADALDIIGTAIARETRRNPSLTIEFDQAVRRKLTEIPEWNKDRTIVQVKDTVLLKPEQWKSAGNISATFMLEGTETKPGLIVTVYRKEKEPKEISFEIEPHSDIGWKIGNEFLNESPRYRLWNRGTNPRYAP